MSQENVEIVRQAFDAVSRGDIDGVLRVCDEEIVITQPSETAGRRVLASTDTTGPRAFRDIWPED